MPTPTPLLGLLLRSLLASVLPVAGGACSGDGGSSGFADAAVAGDAAGDAAPTGPGVSGRLLDETGEPRGNEMILACMATVCLFGDTDSQGDFAFAIEPPAEVALKTPPYPLDVPRRGAALRPVVIVDDRWIEAGPIYVPHLPAGVPFQSAASDPQTLALGDGLEVTLRRADLTPRIGDTLFDAAARAIPPARQPPLELGDEEVVAMYALHPFGAVSSSPIAVRVESDLPAGTAVKFRTISEIDGHLSEPVGAEADGAVIETDVGSGVLELTWLVISR